MRFRNFKGRLIFQLIAASFALFILIIILKHNVNEKEQDKAVAWKKRNSVHSGSRMKDAVPNMPLQSSNNDAYEIINEHVIKPPLLVGEKIFGMFGNLFNGGDNDKQILPPPEKKSEHSTTSGPRPIFRGDSLGNFETEEAPREGPGEGGKPVYLSMDEKTRGQDTVHEYGFNMVVSGKIDMERTVPDIRMPECKHWDYPKDLPSASVVVVFHNEGFSVLMRTVHSIVKRSPKEFLKEVVLVDDMSDMEELKDGLDKYIKRWNGLVRLHRNKEHEGLIRARSIGAKLSQGDVVAFLDAHCEVNYNWLVPLLSVIRHNRKVMAVPIVDGIDANTFEYRSVYSSVHHRGIFEWGFLYKESQVPKTELDRRVHSSEPYNSPTHAGGLFAIDREWFKELGYYDPGLEIWGGEQYELSFKVWQCGGGLMWVPCSRVGHIYRLAVPRNRGKSRTAPSNAPLLLLNHKRVVEVWMDEPYKEYFYRREPLIRDYPLPDDIKEQFALKERLQCKNFSFFMDNVAYDLTEHFPPPPENKYWGELKLSGSRKCWDVNTGDMGSTVKMFPCHSGGGNQLLRLNIKGQLASGERCIECTNTGSVTVQYCPVQPKSAWEYDPAKQSLYHRTYSMCVEAFDSTVRMRQCDPSNEKQHWEFKEIHPYS